MRLNSSRRLEAATSASRAACEGYSHSQMTAGELRLLGSSHWTENAATRQAQECTYIAGVTSQGINLVGFARQRLVVILHDNRI